MASESPYFAEHFQLVESPDRWASAIKAMKSIPKFLNVWNKTKNVYTSDFVKFVDSI